MNKTSDGTQTKFNELTVIGLEKTGSQIHCSLSKFPQ